MISSRLIRLDPHPSKRAIETERLGRSVPPLGEALGIGLRAPEFVAACKAGNLAAPATEAVLAYPERFGLNVHFAVERLDLDTLTALALIELDQRPGGFSPQVVERARVLVATEEWVPASGAIHPTTAEAVCYWAMAPHMDVGFRIVAILDYLKDCMRTDSINAIARMMHEERQETVAQWRKVATVGDGAIAIISSKSAEAMRAAQAVADVAVWVIGNGTPRSRVVKIWQGQPGLVNLAGFHEEIGELEVGWGGNTVSAESSLGCKLDVNQIVRLLVKYHINRSSIVRVRIEELLDDADFTRRVRSGDPYRAAELLEWVKLSHL